MLDWVLSKVAMSVAAILLIVVGAGYLDLWEESSRTDELTRVAEEIADIVNELQGVNGRVRLRIGPRSGSVGNIPASIDQRSYTITIGHELVMVTQEDRSASAQFHERVQPWSPESDAYTSDEFDESDTDAALLRVDSGTELVVERRLLTVDGTYQWHTFIYAAEESE